MKNAMQVLADATVEVTALELLATLQASNLARVYSGKAGCGCGCRGKYSETKSQRTRVLNAMRAATLDGAKVTVQFSNKGVKATPQHDGDNWSAVVAVETDSRYLWAYVS